MRPLLAGLVAAVVGGTVLYLLAERAGWPAVPIAVLAAVVYGSISVYAFWPVFDEEV